MQTRAALPEAASLKDVPDARPWLFRPGLAGYVWPAPRPRARLLLQHGYAEYAERYVDAYSRLIPHLLASGLTVYAFDMRGHGASDGHPGLVDVGAVVDDHLAARADLARHGEPVFLFGHSLGGLVTAASAMRDPRGIEGVVLSSPALKLGASPALLRITAFLAALAPRLPAARQGPADAMTRRPALVEASLADPRFYRGPLPMRLAASALQCSDEVSAGSGRWTSPTLVIHGDADTATDPAGSRDFAAAIASPDKTWVEIAHGRHELLNDIGSEETLALILDWLSGRLRGA